MKGEYCSYHISTKVKPSDQTLTNYSHFNDPNPKCISVLKKYVFFYCFFFKIDTYLMIKFIIKVETDRKY